MKFTNGGNEEIGVTLTGFIDEISPFPAVKLTFHVHYQQAAATFEDTTLEPLPSGAHIQPRGLYLGTSQYDALTGLRLRAAPTFGLPFSEVLAQWPPLDHQDVRKISSSQFPCQRYTSLPCDSW